MFKFIKNIISPYANGNAAIESNEQSADLTQRNDSPSKAKNKKQDLSEQFQKLSRKSQAHLKKGELGFL